MTTHQHRPIAEIQAELDAALAAEHHRKLELKNSITPKYKFHIEPKQPERFDEIWDPSVVMYRLSGRIINKAQCIERGWDRHELPEGSMVYYFNTGTDLLVATTGGGSIWISAGFAKTPTRQVEFNRVRHEIEKFIAAHPEGGDITEIVEEHRRRQGFSLGA